MKKYTMDPSELIELMRYYFTTAARLFRWKEDENRRNLEEKILNLILAIRGKEEYLEACLEILGTTALLQTLTDCAMVKLGGDLIPKEQRGYFELKAEALRDYQVQETMEYDQELMLINNRQAASAGDPGALRLGAALAWLEIDREASQDAAIRHWSVLAYTGDEFAMRALEFAYRENGASEKARDWHQIREILREADRQFSFTVPNRFFRTTDGGVIDTAQLILAVRSRCSEEKKEILPLPMLRYVMESDDDLSVKLQNLYAEPAVYHVLLIRQSRVGHKQYGF